MKLTTEQRIQKAHVSLMQHKDFCLYSGVFMIGKVDIRDDVPTAATNGRDVTYGRRFVDSLTAKQLAFVVLHEAKHKAYRHLTVWRDIAKENLRLANAAMDFVINLESVDQDPNESAIAMPRDADGKLLGCFDERFRGMDTKQVYNILKAEQKQARDKGKGSGGKGDKSDESPDDEGEGDGFDKHDWDGARSLSEEETKQLAKEIDSALREGSILVGKMKGNVTRGVDEVLHPKVDWKEALREFIKTNTRGGDQSTWRRPHRKYLACDVIMPSAESHKAETFVVGIDTSGSIGGTELAQFLGELKCIADDVMPERIELLYWDSRVAAHETYRGAEVANLLDATKPDGGGGTTPDCVPEYLHEQRITPQCVIMLTDGHFMDNSCGDWSKCAVPVLWCVVGNSAFVPTFGQSIFVE